MSARRGVGWLGALAVSAALALLVACGGERIAEVAEQEAQPAAADQTEAAEKGQSRAATAQSGQDQPQPSGESSGADDAQAGARQEAGSDAARGQLAGTALRPGPIDADYAMELLRAIAEEIGPRFNGQPSEREMIEFMVEALRSEGYEAAIEPFEFVGIGSEHVIYVVSASDGPANTTAILGSLMEGSPDVPASGPIVLVPGIGTADDFASVEAAGAFAVVERGELTFSEKQRNAQAAGAVALLVIDPAGPFRGSLEASGAGAIPVFAADGWTAQLLRDIGDANAMVEPPATEGEFLESWNVVARRAGGVCRVVVGGHYDSVPNVQGANDNASGIAVTLALARAWAGAASAADVCFVGFGAEELGLHGSQAFVEAARESGELAEITAMLNLDAFGNGERPIIGVGSEDLTELFERLGEQLGIEVESGEANPGQGSDHAAFYQAGVPVIFPITRGGILHVPADNVDNIDATLVRDVGLLAQAMLECLLERAGSQIEPRLSCDAESQ